jgi:hypothetical protein
MPLSLPLLTLDSIDDDGDDAILVALKLLKLLIALYLDLVNTAGSYVPLCFTDKSSPFVSISGISDVVVFVALVATLRKSQMPSREESQWVSAPLCLQLVSICNIFLLVEREGNGHS